MSAKNVGEGTHGRQTLKMLRALEGAALMLFVTSALPLRAPARGAKHLKQQALKGCPVEGGEKLTGSEAMTMYEDGSTCARAGEKGLDRAALDVPSSRRLWPASRCRSRPRTRPRAASTKKKGGLPGGSSSFLRFC